MYRENTLILNHIITYLQFQHNFNLRENNFNKRHVLNKICPNLYYTVISNIILNLKFRVNHYE